MVKLKFTDQMKSILSEMKGKTFKSYEGVHEGRDSKVYFYGNFRINLGQFSIEFTNHVEDVDFIDRKEELSCFKCEKVDKNSEFEPYLAGPHLEFMVDERIKSVSIVSDSINLNDGEYEIEIDMSIVIRTDSNTYTFTRDWYYGEDVSVYVDKEREMTYSIKNVRDDWEFCGENKVDVQRSIEEL